MFDLVQYYALTQKQTNPTRTYDAALCYCVKIKINFFSLFGVCCSYVFHRSIYTYINRTSCCRSPCRQQHRIWKYFTTMFCCMNLGDGHKIVHFDHIHKANICNSILFFIFFFFINSHSIFSISLSHWQLQIHTVQIV